MVDLDRMIYNITGQIFKYLSETMRRVCRWVDRRNSTSDQSSAVWKRRGVRSVIKNQAGGKLIKSIIYNFNLSNEHNFKKRSYKKRLQ